MPETSLAAALTRALSIVAALLLASGCEGERIVTAVGHGVIRMPSTSVQVGERMTVVAGVLYDDGRFVPFQNVHYLSSDTTKATIDGATGVVTGVAQGTSTLSAAIPQVATLDTTVTVVP